MCRSCRCRACVWYCSGRCDQCVYADFELYDENPYEREDLCNLREKDKVCLLATVLKKGVWESPFYKDAGTVHQKLLQQLEEVKKVVKVSQLSNFVSVADVKTGDVLTFKDPGQIRSAEETPFGREVFQISVELPTGEVKTMTVNKTSIRNLSKIYGEETQAWVNEQAVVNVLQQNVRGDIKDVIYLNPLQKKLAKK